MDQNQLDLFGADFPAPVVSTVHVPGQGGVLQTAGGGWRARFTGQHWGWVFYRAIAPFGWETWEPDLPYGIEQVGSRAEAVTELERLVAAYGDDPHWLHGRRLLSA